MEIAILYFFTIILANTVGAISGMGGGVIIKPVFDFIGAHNLLSISFYSSVAVFTMSIVSIWKQWRSGTSFNIRIALLVSAGSIIGGVAGNGTFEFLLYWLKNDATVQYIQIFVTIVSLLFALIYTSQYREFSFHLKTNVIYIVVGFFLGFLSSLLGIGGGPINVAFFIFLFGTPIKAATVYSIITIFFSQFTKIVVTGFTVGYGAFDLSMLLSIIPAAILGGYLGALLNGKLSNQSVVVVYQMLILLVIVLNITNGIQLFYAL